MPAYQYVDDGSGVTVIVREGVVSPAEDHALMRDRLRRYEHYADRPVLVDLRRLDGPPPSAWSPDFLETLMVYPGRRLAVVVSSRGTYGLARALLVLLEHSYSVAEVWYDWSTAARWLTGGRPVGDPAVAGAEGEGAPE